MAVRLFTIEAFKLEDGTPPTIPGYLVRSTAPENIEESLRTLQHPVEPMEFESDIRAIATHLVGVHQRSQGALSPEILIAVHGYNTALDGVKAWYRSIFEYANREDPVIQQRSHQVLIGYRWTSEKILQDGLNKTFRALPIPPRLFFRFWLLCAIVIVVIEFFVQESQWLDLLFDGLLAVFVALSALIITLVLLRGSVYFRDQYRASTFGVPDLVELVRQLDYAIIKQTGHRLYQAERQQDQESIDREEGARTQPDSSDGLTVESNSDPFTEPLLEPPSEQEIFNRGRAYWEQAPNKIKLSFLGHSMGGFVVTHTVRILSDVFDPRSVEKHPPPDIGSSLYLDRLILASPDIPILAILPGRANFLASSLRRFSEAYLFSNEGDIALRMASTTANYFSFPSARRDSGYRLGNVTVLHSKGYGLANLRDLQQHYADGHLPAEGTEAYLDTALKNLFTANFAKSEEDTSLAVLCQQWLGQNPDRLTIADLFTYFDCTDYKDTTDRSKGKIVGVMSRAERKLALSRWDYVGLFRDYAKAPDRGQRDVHGGYFIGTYSKLLVYRLLFLGMGGLLDTLNAPTRDQALIELDRQCAEKGIQVLLSPFRYCSDVQATPAAKEAIRQAFLTRVKS